MHLGEDFWLFRQVVIDALAGGVEYLNDLYILSHFCRVCAAEQIFQEMVETIRLFFGKLCLAAGLFSFALRNLSTVAFFPGDAHLSRSRNQPAKQSKHDYRGGGDAGFVAPDEFAHAVTKSVLPR
jgi:hypothetical protein